MALAAVVAVPFAHGQAFNDFPLSPHDYYDRDPTDPMSRLLARVEAGEEDLGSLTGLPLVRRLLKEFDVPASSQVLVFSQTSLQRSLIEPANPRAMWFDEETYLAWMPGGKVEIISFDPALGGRFFIEEPPEGGEPVRFRQPKRCFGCHGGAATNFLPGLLGRSHFTSESGRRLGRVKSHDRTSHEVPLEERWGGYFVTGAPKSMTHMGNVFAVREGGSVTLDRAGERDPTIHFDSAKYPHPGSNVLPLMIFDHQIEAHNLLMEARYRYRHFRYVAEQGEVPGRVREGRDRLFEKLVRYLLFADEASLAGHEMQPDPAFERDFLAERKTSEEGLSLRDFDLETRLFRHRLSYMIHSRTFAEAPAGMKRLVYDRLWEILSPADPPEGWDYFDPGERERIVSILRATKDDLPAEWREDAVASAR